MFFDYMKKYWAMKRKQKTEESILRKQGLDSDAIRKLQNADERDLDHDMNFYSNLDHYIEDRERPAELSDESYEIFLPDFMDELEDERLHKALLKLKPIERQLIALHVVDGIPLRMIASLWNRPYDLIQKRYKRSLQKLRRYY